MNEIEIKETSFIAELKKIIGSARRIAYSAINFAQVQQRGFSERSLRQFRQFFVLFPDLQIPQTLFAESDIAKLRTPLAELQPAARDWYLKS
jgi:hypothetical protein